MHLVPHHGPIQDVILHHGILHHKVALTVSGIAVVLALAIGGVVLSKRGATTGPAPVSMSAWALHMTAALADMPTLKVDEPY